MTTGRLASTKHEWSLALRQSSTFFAPVALVTLRIEWETVSGTPNPIQEPRRRWKRMGARLRAGNHGESGGLRHARGDPTKSTVALARAPHEPFNLGTQAGAFSCIDARGAGARATAAPPGPFKNPVTAHAVNTTRRLSEAGEAARSPKAAS
jgi:hypothetical protein